MDEVLSWEDPIWNDPDGGRVLLHGVIPTVVYPQAMRPRIPWDGLALVATEEEEEVWAFEEESEKESAGINLAEAMMGGGVDQMYLERLLMIENLQVGRFPDPEPYRLFRLANRHQRPIYYLEPPLSDEAWAEHLGKEADVMTRWRSLLKVPRQGSRFRKLLKQAQTLSSQPKNAGVELQFASALAAVWWWLQEERINKELSEERDERIAARLRTALRDLRAQSGDDALLLVPIIQARRGNILNLLKQGIEPETEKSENASAEGEE